MYCSNVNTRRMSQPDMGSIFHIKNQWSILVIGNYYVNYHNYQNSKLLYSPNTKQTLMHLFLFQYVRRVYTTAINFPCIHRNSHLGSSFLIKIGGGDGGFTPSFGKPCYLVKREPAPVLAEFCKFIFNWTSTRSNTSSRSINIFIQSNK